MIHSTPLEIKINQCQIISIFGLQSISNSYFRNFFFLLLLLFFFFFLLFFPLFFLIFNFLYSYAANFEYVGFFFLNTNSVTSNNIELQFLKKKKKEIDLISTRNGNRQWTNNNENGIQIWKITDMEIKARIQIGKSKQRFKSGN
jgi:hypothetical protein